MNTRKTFIAAGCLGSLLLASSALAGNPMVYKGSAQTSARKSLLPLANGDAVVTSESQGVATISTDPPAILAIRCAGSGMVKGGKYSGDGHCTLRENDNDAFDLRVSDRPELATLEVIGGSGKWSGAAGKGKFTRVSSEGDRNAFTFEIEITTP